MDDVAGALLAGWRAYSMQEHEDSLSGLEGCRSLGEKLHHVHKVLRQSLDFVDRVSVIVYDSKTDLLTTYVDSSDTASALRHYEAALSAVPGLREIVETGRPRVLNDFDLRSGETAPHWQSLYAEGYRSSYTMPLLLEGQLFGFLFFDSRQKDRFQPSVLRHLDLFGHLISLLIVREISAIRTLTAAVSTIREMTHRRDPETGAHLDRMSRYARVIALGLAERLALEDEYVEHVFLFAPLHDIGKVGIPDSILLKPGKLTREEYEQMKSHSRAGREIVDAMLSNFGLETFEHVEVLRNIAEYHHEAVNGMGYPQGLRGREIPLEARIVAVADVFDALTSRRPYKEPWSNERAFAMLRQLSGERLDPDCVQTLEAQRSQVEEIQMRFREDELG